MLEILPESEQRCGLLNRGARNWERVTRHSDSDVSTSRRVADYPPGADHIPHDGTSLAQLVYATPLATIYGRVAHVSIRLLQPFLDDAIEHYKQAS
jgi:hypothetical protein